jgi:hypothetical protein
MRAMVLEDRDQTCEAWDVYQATHGDISRANPRWPGINLEIENGWLVLGCPPTSRGPRCTRGYS